MDLICYTHYGWAPRLRPASSKRQWMDDTPESFAYRCLPLSIANAHGWEVLSPCGFEARWTGGSLEQDVEIRLDPGTPAHQAAVSLFGQGTITFHIEGLFRTPPGWNLWVGGPPNGAKDGIAALGGIIETDWSPYSFTMNWRFTRPNHWVRFEENEPICFLFPVQRSAIEEIEPKFLPLESEPELLAQYEKWSISRQVFAERMRRDPPAKPSDKWQKLYYRGVDPDGVERVADHRSKLRLKPFVDADGKPVPIPEPRACPVVHRPPEPVPPPPAPPQATVRAFAGTIASRADIDLAKRDWMLDLTDRYRALSPRTAGVQERRGIGRDDFLDHFYAAQRPVLLKGELDGWPALERWSPDYLKAKVGSAEIEYQDGRTAAAGFEREKEPHRKRLPFDAYVDRILAEPGNDAYLTAYNSAANEDALAPLKEDLGFLDKLLTREHERPDGMMWIGPMGTFTPLHHDLTNNLLAQLQGAKRIILVPPSESRKLYNSRSVFSDIFDIMDPDLGRFPLAKDVRLFEVDLEAGDCLFIPLGWWHQVTSLDFSVTVTYTNFLWPNEGAAAYPNL